MEWNYKNIIIRVESDGCFYFSINGKGDVSYTLNSAKEKIDKALEFYYTFTKSDITKLFKKLDRREQEFVQNLIDELKRHGCNAYCEIGWSDEFLFSIKEK